MSKFSAKRLRQHKRGQSHWTSKANDWQKLWQIELKNIQDASIFEKKIKKRGAKRFLIDNNIAVPPKAE